MPPQNTHSQTHWLLLWPISLHPWPESSDLIKPCAASVVSKRVRVTERPSSHWPAFHFIRQHWLGWHLQQAIDTNASERSCLPFIHSLSRKNIIHSWCPFRKEIACCAKAFFFNERNVCVHIYLCHILECDECRSVILFQESWQQP